MNDLARMEAAADWLIRLNDAPGDETTINQWLQWCEEDADNLAAFKRTQVVWQAAVPPETRGAASRSVSRSWMALAASVVVGLSCGVWLLSRGDSHATLQSYSTPIAGRALGVLPDGSQVELGAGSRISTHYSDALREVTVDSGEAFFSVQKDARRPFVVTAGNLRVMAVGTAFNVRRGDGRVVIAVEEGKVQLSEGTGATAAEFAAIGAGEQAVYVAQARRVAIAHIQPTDAASWRIGILKYEHEPLSAVAADLNRYSTVKIVIADPSIAQLPFTGTVFSTRIDDALLAFTQVFPVVLVKKSDSVELQRR
jgi:transmembrane sensor